MKAGAAGGSKSPFEEITFHTGEEAGIAQAATVIALGNVSSRILGLIRETVISHLFGATGMVSAFRVASIVPTMIYDLLIGGMISAALVAVFSDYASPEKRQELWRLASALFTLVAIVFCLIVIALELVAPLAAWILGGGFDIPAFPDHPLCVSSCLPFFLGLSGATTGFLYANKRFTYPALAPAFSMLGSSWSFPSG